MVDNENQHPPVRLSKTTYGVIKMRTSVSGRTMGGEIEHLLAVVTAIEEGHEENKAVVIMEKRGNKTKISAPLNVEDMKND